MPLSVNAAPPKTASPRLIQLDLLRGVAILLVLFRHAVIFEKDRKIGIWSPVSHWTHFIGWTGVDLFFVLSGFLIGGLLFQEIKTSDHLDVRRFLIRRGLKIWPGYFALIIFVFVSLIAIDHARIGAAFRNILPNLLHVQNYFGSPRGLTWSLSVEEHFYLALPLLLMFVLARARRPVHTLRIVPIISIAVIAGVTIFRIFHNLHRPFDYITQTEVTHLRIDGLMFGVLLAYFHHFHPAGMARLASRQILLLMCGLALLLPMAFFPNEHPFMTTIGFTMLYLGYGAILLALVYTKPGTNPIGKLLASWPSRAIAFVGFYSYSIYLWQEDLARNLISRHLLHRLRDVPTNAYWPAVETLHLIFAIGAGILMARLIEIPSLALRDRIFPARTPRIAIKPTMEVEPAPIAAGNFPATPIPDVK